MLEVLGTAIRKKIRHEDWSQNAQYLEIKSSMWTHQKISIVLYLKNFSTHTYTYIAELFKNIKNHNYDNQQCSGKEIVPRPYNEIQHEYENEQIINIHI